MFSVSNHDRGVPGEEEAAVLDSPARPQRHDRGKRLDFWEASRQLCVRFCVKNRRSVITKTDPF